LLLQELDNFYEKLSPKEQLSVDLLRVRFFNEQYRAQDVLKTINHVFDHPQKKELLNNDRKTWADFIHEQGIVHLWLNRFDSAIRDFIDAEKVFRRQGNQYQLAVEINWQGYAQFRSGQFEAAEKTFHYAIEEFLELLPQSSEQLLNRIGNVYSNLNATLRHMGRFQEAIHYGEIAAWLARETKNDRELARFLHALGDTYKLAGRYFEASKCYEEALGILESKPDHLLQARVLTGMSLLSYRHYDYIYIFEYYRRGPEQQEILRKFREENRPEGGQNRLLEAQDILENTIRQPTRERADVYFDLGEYYAVRNEWKDALKFFVLSRKTANTVGNKYREMDALVRMLSAYYYAGEAEFETTGAEPYKAEIEGCIKDINILIIDENYQYHNLIGRMDITLGGLSYEKYLKFGKEKELRSAIRSYVVACDELYAFHLNRFYSTIRIVLNRLNDLFPDNLPSEDVIEGLKDIWHYEERERAVCLRFRRIFDEIIDFILHRIRGKASNEVYFKRISDDIESCIDTGKELLGFAPLYGEMLLQLFKESEASDQTTAETYRALGRSYFKNGNVFESQKNYEYAEAYARSSNDRLLLALTLVGLGKSLHRRGVYEKSIEHFLPNEIEANRLKFNKAYENGLSKAEKYFQEAEEILDQIFKETPSDSNVYEKVIFYQAILQCRYAEYLSAVKSGKSDEIEKRLKDAEKKVLFIKNPWWEIKILENLITYYFLSGKLQGKWEEISKFLNRIDEANEQRYSPKLMGLLELTRGNIFYTQINEEHIVKSTIEKAFRHYVTAIRYHAEYSDKLFYEATRTFLLRVAKLPKPAVKVLHEDIISRLQHKWPTGPIAEKAYEKAVQFIKILSALPETADESTSKNSQ
jgi:tetratricopeptide (TPR) repeat protein